MELSVMETIWTGLWARNCANIQQVSILQFAFGPEKFPGLSRNGPLTREVGRQPRPEGFTLENGRGSPIFWTKLGGGNQAFKNI